MFGSEILLLVVAIMAILFVFYKCYKNLYYFPKELEQFPSLTIPLLNYIQCIKKFNSGSEHPLSVVLQLFYSWSLTDEFEKERICCLWFGYKPMIFVFKAEFMKDILSNPEECVPAWEKDLVLRPTTGEGLLLSSGNKWRRRRNMLNPAFHTRVLQNYMEKFNTGAEILVDKLKASVNKPWTDLGPLFDECALSILCDSIFGKKQTDYETQAAMKAWKEMSEISMHRVFRPWTFNNTIFSLTSEGRKLRKAKIVFDKFNEKGHITIAASLNWIIYMLGLLPEVQEKLVEELNCIFGDDIHRETTNKDLKEMAYLDKVIKEVMRIYPPVPLMGVKFKKNKSIGSFTIPKEVPCFIAIYKLHRDQEIFPNPEEFDAERFAPENCRKRHPYAYIPFSMGPRMCIGYQFAMMELKVILSKLLREFEFTSLDPRNRSQEMYVVVLTNSKPLRIRLMQRTPA